MSRWKGEIIMSVKLAEATKLPLPKIKRKRARRRPEAHAAAAPPLVTDDRIERVWRFVERSLTPRVFAAAARRLGAAGVRPRDFHCGCDPASDGLPLCRDKKTGCRFAGRAIPAGSADASARFDKARLEAMTALRAKYAHHLGEN
jgi:hypothetical protein